MIEITGEINKTMNTAGRVNRGGKVEEGNDLSRLRARALAARLYRMGGPELRRLARTGNRTPGGSPPL